MGSFISAVTLTVPDYDQAIDFYVGVLGFDLLEDTKLSDTKRWVKIAPKGAQTALVIAQAEGASQIAAVGNQNGGRVSFFLQTDDFISRYETMRNADVTFTEEPRRESYGHVVVFSDPFGNLWDLIQPI
ncbi:VOC family protein [Ahrensia sp. 13_GOM-1096m]|uniref:VOC family protein n=1 Tax=Ahrensia sp. 13_GOM-1096m TaxID=1380380 RepID=UPI00047AC828|nr:VOC family protein [Ahrensia sp. 13_GOM-1096m]